MDAALSAQNRSGTGIGRALERRQALGPLRRLGATIDRSAWALMPVGMVQLHHVAR